MGKKQKEKNCCIDAKAMSNFFINKVEDVRRATANAPPPDFVSFPVPSFCSFKSVSTEDITSLILSINKSSALDPIPHCLLYSIVDLLPPFITKLIKVSLSSGCVPFKLKSAIVTPVLKKPSLDPNDPKNYPPISNLPFISKLLEKVLIPQ